MTVNHTVLRQEFLTPVKYYILAIFVVVCYFDFHFQLLFVDINSYCQVYYFSLLVRDHLQCYDEETGKVIATFKSIMIRNCFA